MKIIITSVHFKDQKIEQYAREKVEKLEKFHYGIETINVRLIAEKNHRSQDHDFYCEITIHVPKHIVEIKDSERAPDKAIDKAVERAKRALVKHKEKSLSRKHKKGIINKFLGRLGRS